MPAALPPSRWNFADCVPSDDNDLVVIGGDLEPATLIEAYSSGLFPMGLGDHGRPPIGWWSPVERGILTAGDHHVQRSLRRELKRFEVSFDADFEGVVRACGSPQRDGRWITAEIVSAYQRLHELGYAHSIEVWDGHDLVGGLYGVAVGGLFAGESMFHYRTGASKIALWTLVEWWLGADDRRLIDVQWSTEHLSSQGVREVPRAQYEQLLALALGASAPQPPVAGARMSARELGRKDDPPPSANDHR